MARFGPSELALLALCRPELAPRVLAAMQCFEDKTGRKSYVSEGYRTLARQSALYADSLNAAGRQTYRVAKPGTSRHELGSAADIHIVGVEAQTSPLYQVLGHCIESQGLTWGGRFGGTLPDVYHCELRESYSTAVAEWTALRGRHLQRAGLVVAVLIAAVILYRIVR